MRRAWQVIGVSAAAVGLVVGGMGLAQATEDDPGSKRITKPARLAADDPPAPDPDQAVFTPITPCRIADTRATGKVGATGRSFVVAGSNGFPAQGGTSGGCDIPASATAVAANLVSVGATAGGFLKAYPVGSPAPAASVLNYGTAALANELPLAVRPGTAVGLTVTASTPTNLLVDVTGYFAPQIAAYVDDNGEAFMQTGPVDSVERVDRGEYEATIDRDVTNCAVHVTSGYADLYSSAITADEIVYISTWALQDGAESPTDAAFNMVVVC